MYVLLFTDTARLELHSILYSTLRLLFCFEFWHGSLLPLISYGN